MKLREGNPPVIGTCIHCGTNFHSKYGRKTHACKAKGKTGDDKHA